MGLKTDNVFYSIYLTEELVIIIARGALSSYGFTLVDVKSDDDVDLLV